MYLTDEKSRPILTEFGQGILAESAMPITDVTAVKFCNEQVRVAADLLARAYYLCDAAKDQWDALGGGQPAVDVMTPQIRAAANAVVAAYQHCFLAEKIWFLGTNSVIPNTSETIVDGSPADGRPEATGAKVHAVMARAIEFQNWLFSTNPDQVGAGEGFLDTGRDNAAAFNTVLSAGKDGPPVLTASNAGKLINRAGELRTNYEASSNVNLGTLLAFAVNPNPQ